MTSDSANCNQGSKIPDEADKTKGAPPFNKALPTNIRHING
jgi:hypothetical protein